MKSLRGVPSPLGGTQTPNSVSSVLGGSWNLLSVFSTFHLLVSADFLQNLHLKIQGSAEDFRGVYMHSWGLPLGLFFPSLLFHYSNPIHHVYFLNNWTPCQSSWFKSFSLQTILHDTARFHSLIYLSDSWWVLTQKTILSSSQAVAAIRLACHMNSTGKETNRPNLFR